MTWKMTRNHVQAKVDTINRMLGFDPEALQYNTIGSIQLSHGIGYSIHRVCNESGGVQDLCTSGGTLRECAAFLNGMIHALELKVNK